MYQLLLTYYQFRKVHIELTCWDQMQVLGVHGAITCLIMTLIIGNKIMTITTPCQT